MLYVLIITSLIYFIKYVYKRETSHKDRVIILLSCKPETIHTQLRGPKVSIKIMRSYKTLSTCD